MIEALFLLVSLTRSSIKNRTELALENLALRQQLAILNRKRPQPRLRKRDRFSGLAFLQSGRNGENPSSWSSPKQSSDGIGKGLHYIGSAFQSERVPADQEQAKTSAIWFAKWPMRIRPGEVPESTGNCKNWGLRSRNGRSPD